MSKREVDAEDLELFAITTGEFYPLHVDLASARASEPLWQLHVVVNVVPLYCRQVEPVVASTEVVQAVGEALRAYYHQHVLELEAA